MRILEIHRQLKTRRNYREGNYAITVMLENPGDEFQEFLRVKVTEGNKVVAKALFKQWQGKPRWSPLNINVIQKSTTHNLREMMLNAVTHAGFLIED